MMATLAGLRRFWRRGAPDLLPTPEAYALWADTYPPWPHNPLMRSEHAVVAALIAAARPRRALDAGTGTGRLLPLLHAAGARVVIGLDLSMTMLQHRADAVPRVCANASTMPFAPGAFDLVCSSLMAGDVEDLGTWIKEAARVLAPGGHLVYSDFHQAWSQEGWRRTFITGDGRQIQLAYFPHAMDEHLTRLEQASLSVRAIREPRLPGRTAPGVVVFHAVKPLRRGAAQ
jgi:malonyl-CoA O-methyltransferase